jgi:sec-independent protein translocase protein TatA
LIGDILQPTHLLFIFAVALLVLGPKRLPEVGRALGRGIRDFRQAMTFDDNERDALNVRQSITEATAPITAPMAVPAPTAPVPVPAPTQPAPAIPPTEPHTPQS